MKIGVDYYPEQWDRELWSRDAALMAQTGVKVVRLADFAWSRLEPEDGQYDFSWLDDVIAVFANYKIETVLCVPVNCPPEWLCENYPEIIQNGGNRQRCINSPVFLEYAKSLTEEMAKHYCQNPAIAAWQIDNKPEISRCSCDACTEKFQNWLEDRYDTAENMNKAFGASRRSGGYRDFSQVQLPSDCCGEFSEPALSLDYYRFRSESMTQYVNLLASIIRRYSPKAKITSNTAEYCNKSNVYQFYDNLDFVSCDNYPPVKPHENGENDCSNAFFLDMMRGVHNEDFWVVEQLSGIKGSPLPMSRSPRPEMIKGYCLQAAAHGAETVLQCRWRSPLTGEEMFRQGILDHSNIPSRRFFEFSELCKIASKLSIMRKTEIISDIAIIYSPECEYALKIQPQSENFEYISQLKSFYAAFSVFGANVDVVSPEADLSDYKIVVAPALFVNKKAATENLYRYVINGGTLVMTGRSGVKNHNNNCIMEVLPTDFRELIGAEISEYDPLGKDETTIVDFAGNKFRCSQWCDVLKLGTARAYAEYAEGVYRCCPAITVNEYCGGIAYYIGTVCGPDFYRDFASKLMKQKGVPRLKGLPEGVEVTTRSNGMDDFIFFFNNSENEAVIQLPKAMYSIINSSGKDRIELKPYEMEVLRK